jgi:hypothetical protein
MIDGISPKSPEASESEDSELDQPPPPNQKKKSVTRISSESENEDDGPIDADYRVPSKSSEMNEIDKSCFENIEKRLLRIIPERFEPMDGVESGMVAGLSKRYESHQKFVSELCVLVFTDEVLQTHSWTGSKDKNGGKTKILSRTKLDYIQRQLRIRRKIFGDKPRVIYRLTSDQMFKEMIVKVTRTKATMFASKSKKVRT